MIDISLYYCTNHLDLPSIMFCNMSLSVLCTIQFNELNYHYFFKKKIIELLDLYN